MNKTRYATLAEAAALAGMPPDQFAAWAPARGIVPVAWGASTLYRWADIEAAIDAAWQASIDGATAGPSRGSRAGGSGGSVSVQLPRPKPRRPGSRRSSSSATPPSAGRRLRDG